jgi:hypothetical protein
MDYRIENDEREGIAVIAGVDPRERNFHSPSSGKARHMDANRFSIFPLKYTQKQGQTKSLPHTTTLGRIFPFQ